MGDLVVAVVEEANVVGGVVGARVSAVMELAVAMAGVIESADASAAAKASCGKVLLEALGRLHESVPVERREDVVDVLAERRLARLAAAKDPAVKRAPRKRKVAAS